MDVHMDASFCRVIVTDPKGVLTAAVDQPTTAVLTTADEVAAAAAAWQVKSFQAASMLHIDARSVRIGSLLIRHRLVGDKALGHRLLCAASPGPAALGVQRVRLDLPVTRASERAIAGQAAVSSARVPILRFTISRHALARAVVALGPPEREGGS